MGQSFCRKAVGLLTPVQPARAASASQAAHTGVIPHAGSPALQGQLPSLPHSAPQATRHFRDRGVTLIEMLVAVTILGILAAAAMPNFTSFLHNSRLGTEATKLFLDIELARSEAARRNTTVTICPLASGNACSSDWSQPRIIFVDADGDGNFGATEELIRHSDTPWAKTTVSALNLGVTPNLVRFRSSGISNAPSGSWSFCESGSKLAGQTLTLSGSGRPLTQQQTPCS